MAELERQAQARVFTPIRNTVKAGEVVALREFLADYAPQATATEDYDQVAIEILEAVGAVKTSTKSKEAS